MTFDDVAKDANVINLYVTRIVSTVSSQYSNNLRSIDITI